MAKSVNGLDSKSNPPQDGLIQVDAATFSGTPTAALTRCRTASPSAPSIIALLDHGAITVGNGLRVRVARSLAGSSARGMLEELDVQEIRLPIDLQLHPNPGHLRWHRSEAFKGRV